MPKDLGDSKGTQQDVRYRDTVQWIEAVKNVYLYRLFGQIQPYIMHWPQSINGKSYPMGCTAFNMDLEEYTGVCLHCDDGMIKSKNYYMHAIDRYKQKNGARNPIGIMRMTGDVLGDLGKHLRDDAWGNPTDPNKGYDLKTTYVPQSDKGRAKYETTAQPPTPLTEQERALIATPDFLYDLIQLCELPTYSEQIISALISGKHDRTWLDKTMDDLLRKGLLKQEELEALIKRYDAFIAKHPDFATSTVQVPATAPGAPVTETIAPPPPPPETVAPPPPITTPVAPPVTPPPVTAPVAPPVAPPPITTPVAPPVTPPPVTAPVAPPVAPPPITAPVAPPVAPPPITAPVAPPVAPPPITAPVAPPVAPPPVTVPITPPESIVPPPPPPPSNTASPPPIEQSTTNQPPPPVAPPIAPPVVPSTASPNGSPFAAPVVKDGNLDFK